MESGKLIVDYVSLPLFHMLEFEAEILLFGICTSNIYISIFADLRGFPMVFMINRLLTQPILF